VKTPLPATICFRVTRYCNARCGFCLAPPDGAHPGAQTLLQRIDWLLERGVASIHFCGGEPTIHPALPELLAYVRSRGKKSRLTTNGIALSDELFLELQRSRTQVKVSLHGDREHHDAMVGREAFGAATDNLRRLVAARVSTSVQTTVVRGGEWVLDRMAGFCIRERVKRLSILPFIPRGSGLAQQHEYGLTSAERGALRDLVCRKRRELSGRLDLRWLDFTARPFHVVEADGRLLLEGATEALDEFLERIEPRAQPSGA